MDSQTITRPNPEVQATNPNRPCAELTPLVDGFCFVAVYELNHLVGYLRNDQETGRLEVVSYGLADRLSESSAKRVVDRFNVQQVRVGGRA